MKLFEEFPEKFIVNLENIFTDTFCPNKQFDGGVFDWVSENCLLFSRKFGTIYFLNQSLLSYYGDSLVKKKISEVKV